MDISALNSLSKTLSNIEIYQPELPDYEDTVCGKMDRLNSTQESQLNELEKIRYENIKRCCPSTKSWELQFSYNVNIPM